MSKWQDLYNIDRVEFTRKIKKMSMIELLNAVDDIVQIDMLHLSADAWIDDTKDAVYHRCMAELRRKSKKGDI